MVKSTDGEARHSGNADRTERLVKEMEGKKRKSVEIRTEGIKTVLCMYVPVCLCVCSCVCVRVCVCVHACMWVRSCTQMSSIMKHPADLCGSSLLGRMDKR